MPAEIKQIAAELSDIDFIINEDCVTWTVKLALQFKEPNIVLHSNKLGAFIHALSQPQVWNSDTLLVLSQLLYEHEQEQKQKPQQREK